MRGFITFIFFGIILVSCSPSRHVVPLKKREQAIAISVGGPIVNIPGIATMPVPLSSITYGRGLTNNTTVFGTWHTTAAVYGVAQFDIGATHSLWRKDNDKMGISLTVL